jgi:iron complex transport system substrate-binding protein
MSCQPGAGKKGKGIIVLSPEVAEIVCALDAETEIIGITAECNYPSSLSSIPKVGSFSSLDKEQIIALNPRIIFCSALEQEGMAAELSKLGYQVEVIYPTSLQSLGQAITRIGALIDRKTEASALNENLENSIRQIKSKAMAANGKRKPKVYLEIYRNPLMSVADSSFVGELIETAGGDNIFGSLERDYARVNPEMVINAKPDIMICYSQESLESILSRKGWQDIPALKNRRIYFDKDLNPDLLQRATPRCIEGMLKLQTIFELWRLEIEK